MSASNSTFLLEAASCCANRALPRRPLLVEAIGKPGVGPGGAVSGVRFGEEVWGPEVCLLLLVFAACQPRVGGGYLMAPELQTDPASLAILERWSADVTPSAAAVVAPASRMRLL
jgi:hypothetical protein